MNEVWKVHKFGGTSVLNAERYKGVFDIITGSMRPGPKGIVVSAMKGVTDDLIGAIELAKQQIDFVPSLNRIHERHLQAIQELLPKEKQGSLIEVFNTDFKKISEILRGVFLVKSAAENIVELISGMGEVWSAQILNAYLQKQGLSSTWLDAREVLKISRSHNQVSIKWPESKKLFSEWLNRNKTSIVIITGFVASYEDGTITTLGRNGSDYSGSIFGALFNCDEVFIWTDVDGVLSADPRLVPEAVVLDEMSYSEVSELAYFGARVVHPSTMVPAVDLKIPIWIKNTFHPNNLGTKIHGEAKSDRAVKGFSTIEEMALLNIEGPGMVGVPGVAERLFSALKNANINVVLISQASSEHSICFAVSEKQASKAKEAVQQAFIHEIQTQVIREIQITLGVSILAAVGDNMAQSPGVAGQFFTALGRAQVNVRAIAQGSSERNISAVIESKDSVRALRTVHSAFILPHLPISLGLIGTGTIGGTFLKQLAMQVETLRANRKIDIQVRGIANSKKMWLSEAGIDLKSWNDNFAQKAEPLDLEKFAKHLRSSYISDAVVVEATASSLLAPYYPKWLASGLHIISPNKKANTGSMFEYKSIRDAGKKAKRHFLYSTNVGAGLPIIQTLRDLKATGDTIYTVQGIFSGTLSYIFNQFDGTRPFSEIVMEAKAKGYTEPDPRDDLSGQDVARKLVILARESGLPIEVSDISISSLVPEKLQKINKDEFLKSIVEMDSLMSDKFKEAKDKGQILRFVGTIDSEGRANVGLESLPNTHAFAHVTGTDNIVLFKTQRYFTQPLVVQGPGAGPEVTAAGVFADLLRLSQYLGANS